MEPQGISESVEIVRTNQSMVFSIAYHLLQDRGLAEEVAQDIFVQLHANLREIESAAHVVFWLRKVTVHRAIDRARWRDNKREVPLDSQVEPAAEFPEADPILSRRLQQLVASLPEKPRAVPDRKTPRVRVRTSRMTGDAEGAIL